MDKFMEKLRHKKEEVGAVRMAQIIGIHHSALYRILNEEREMRLDTLKKILRAYPDLSPELTAIFLSEDSPICDEVCQLATISTDTVPIATEA